MNERIDELMQQSGARFEFLHGVHYDDFCYKTFAELIIEDCTNICHKLADVSDSWVVHDGDTCAAQIKKHFGVKE
jgi:hypothetical protein